ncbi:MAG: hypothetical protein N2484_01375 [Clostridia bacterium]|nr:hypothetical protein [Clostridia bacterium]
MSAYIGETVTIFVRGGGASGMGFTGILLHVNDEYVHLITRIGPPPACSLGNGCFRPHYPGISPMLYYSRYFSWLHNGVKAIGSAAYIPVNKIASFVHNNA